MIRHRTIIIAALLLALVGCKPSLPDGVLSERKMERVLYDFHLAQGMADYAPRQNGEDYESVRYELHQAVFRKHGITQEDFDRSMAYYLSDMDKMYAIYKRLSDRLEREAEALGVAAGPRDIYAQLTEQGDTANVWADRPIFVLRNRRLINFQMWSLDCDSTWLPGDDVMWRFLVQDIKQNYSSSNIYADLVVVYDNDSIRSRLTSLNIRNSQPAIGERTEQELRIDNPENWTPRSVSGHLFADISSDPQQERIFIIYAPSLIRFHDPLYAHGTVSADSIARSDSLLTDSSSLSPVTTDSTAAPSRRLSPEQFREQQPVDRTIDVVKQKPYQAPRRSNRKRFTQPTSPRNRR